MLTIRKFQLLLIFIPFSAYSITENRKTIENDSVKFYYEIGLRFFDKNKDSSLYYTEKAIRFGENKNISSALADSYQLKGRCLFYKSEFNNAIVLYNKALTLNLEKDDKIALADNYFYLSQAYNLKNDYSKVLSNLNNARKYYEILKDSLGIARIYNNYAILYGKQNKIELEEENLEKAIQILKTIKSEQAKKLLDVINFNKALNLRDDKKYEEALKIFQEQYFLYKIKNRTNLPLVTRAIGKTYLGMKNFALAEKYLQEAIDLYEENKNISGFADCYREISEVYFSTNRIQKAIEVTEYALKKSNEIGELESVKLSYEKLHKYYSYNKNYSKAYENLLMFKKISDSIFNEKINDDLTQQKIDFEITKNNLINNNKRKLYEQVTKNKLNTQKTIIYSIIVIALLFIITTFFNYRQYKKTEKQNFIINKQKKKIELSLNEKDVLLKEVYHRVKNNLQIINSLLEIQSNHDSNPNFKNSVKEAQTKIQVMSLLHQNLYNSKDFNFIDINFYIHQLVEYFSNIYLHYNQVKFQIKCENIPLEISQAIPLGLIINEITSNAFKHSFKVESKGTISITLKSYQNTNVLTIENDGILLPDNFNPETQNTLGLKLVRILSEQINGKLTFYTIENKNVFTIKFNS
jgi:two-component sensor histidine kinase